jgi:hypothetical protein
MYVFTIGLFERSPDQFLYMNYAYFLVKQLLYHSDLIFYLWVTQLLYGPISMRLSSASSWKSRNNVHLLKNGFTMCSTFILYINLAIKDS